MASGTSKQFVVLLVDDDFDFLELVSKHLECQFETNFEIYVAADGAEAIAQIGALSRIDVLITDFNMPHANGLAVAIEFSARFPESPVILTTGASPVDEQIVELLKLPNTEILRKPFLIMDLAKKLASVREGRNFSLAAN